MHSFEKNIVMVKWFNVSIYEEEESMSHDMTEVIFIGAISNKNRKTIRLLCSTILEAAIL